MKRTSKNIFYQSINNSSNVHLHLFTIFSGNWCADVFINQFNHRGNASCSRASQAVVNTTCEGYDGFMCSVIKTRVCTLTDKRQNLKPCSRSNLMECFMKSKQSGKYYHCQHFKGKLILKAHLVLDLKFIIDKNITLP